MNRIPRTHVTGSLVYMTSRGDNNESIFKDEADYRNYLELLKKYKAQYGFKLFAFCLLPNHLHLLMELKEGLTTSEIMHDLNANYTKYFNGRYQRKGHLFQERYKMLLMEKDAYILPAMNYIHLNPLALGLTKDLAQYQYSSYLYYTPQPTACSPQIDIQEETKEIKFRLLEIGQQDYALYLKGIPKESMQALGKDLSKKIIFGSQDFNKRVQQAAEPVPEKHAGVYQERKFIIIGSVLIAVLGLFSIFLFARTMFLKGAFTKELSAKEAELSRKLKEEKQLVVKDLQEKYQADMVSYQAMAKRVEIEKKRTAQLEEQLKGVKKGSPIKDKGVKK